MAKNHFSSSAKNLKKDAQRLKSVPAEYHASVYAQMEQEKRVEQDVTRRKSLALQRGMLKELQAELRKAGTEAARTDLLNKISSCEKVIRTSLKPIRKWSPTLPGSFGSGRKR